MHNKGFTLIECVITLLLLGALSIISLTVTSAFRLKAEQSTLVQTDLLAASSCIERIKAVAQAGEFEAYKNQKLSCPNNVKPTITALTSDDSSLISKGILKFMPADQADDKNAAFYLITVSSGTVELHYVVSKK